MSNEYKTHSFKKDWHEKVMDFLAEYDDLAFDSPKYFIKFCVNQYIEEKKEEQTIDLERMDELNDVLDEMLKKEKS